MKRVVGLAALAFLEYYVPRDTIEAAGVVVAYRTTALRGGGLQRYVAVRLDRGLTVEARIDGHIPVRVGKAVLGTEATGSVFGFNRQRFSRHVDGHQGSSRYGAEAAGRVRSSNLPVHPTAARERI